MSIGSQAKRAGRAKERARERARKKAKQAEGKKIRAARELQAALKLEQQRAMQRGIRAALRNIYEHSERRL